MYVLYELDPCVYKAHKFEFNKSSITRFQLVHTYNGILVNSFFINHTLHTKNTLTPLFFTGLTNGQVPHLYTNTRLLAISVCVCILVLYLEVYFHTNSLNSGDVSYFLYLLGCNLQMKNKQSSQAAGLIAVKTQREQSSVVSIKEVRV